MNSDEGAVPNQQEVLNHSDKSRIEQLAQKVFQSLEKVPITPKTDKGDDVFWGSVGILDEPDATYGDVSVLPRATNEWGSTTGSRRDILMQEKKVGDWKKEGYFKPNSDTAVWFREEVKYPVYEEGERKIAKGINAEAIKVFIDSQRRVSSIRREVTENAYSPTAIQELRYEYTQDGRLFRIKLFNINPQTIDPKTLEKIPQREISEEEIFFDPQALGEEKEKPRPVAAGVEQQQITTTSHAPKLGFSRLNLLSRIRDNLLGRLRKS